MAAVRRLYIKQEYLDLYRYTQHCPKCLSIIVHGSEARSTVPHSERCRARITAEVAKTEDGQERLEKVTDKSDRFYAKKISQSETLSGRLQGGKPDSSQRMGPTSLIFMPYEPEDVPVATKLREVEAP